MRRLSLLLAMICCVFVLPAQQNSKLISDIKKLSGEYLTDFKNIRGGVKSDDEYNTVFYSRLTLYGAREGTSIINYHKEDQRWEFRADIDTLIVSKEELFNTIKAGDFSFGKLKQITGTDRWVFDFIPANKKGLVDKLRSFLVRFIICPDETECLENFILGRMDTYMNK